MRQERKGKAIKGVKKKGKKNESKGKDYLAETRERKKVRGRK